MSKRKKQTKQSIPQKKRTLRPEPKEQLDQKAATDLKRGDVILWDGKCAAVIKPSDSCSSLAEDERTRGGTPASRCCEPRIQFLDDNRKLTNKTTYIIVPKTRNFLIMGKVRV